MDKKEKPRTKINIRQKKVIKELVANGGTMKNAMVKAGYSEAYAKNPKKIETSLTYQELLDKYLPDDIIAQRHRQLLDKKEQIVVRNGKDSEIVLTDEIDANAVAKGIDMAYKIKGSYAPEKIDATITAVNIVNYGDKKDV